MTITSADTSLLCGICGKPTKRVTDSMPDGAPVGWCCDPRNKMKEGHAIRQEHGLHSSVTKLPDSYRVVIPPSADRGMLLDNLGQMLYAGQTILEELTMSAEVETIEFVGPYQQLVRRLSNMSAEIEGGKLTAGRYGKLSPETVEKMQEDYASALSNGLTKLKHAFEWAREYGIMQEVSDKKGKLTKRVPRKTLIQGIASTLAGSANIVEGWMRLNNWEQKTTKKAADGYLEAYATKKTKTTQPH